MPLEPARPLQHWGSDCCWMVLEQSHQGLLAQGVRHKHPAQRAALLPAEFLFLHNSPCPGSGSEHRILLQWASWGLVQQLAVIWV